jgi:hypothetical protein
MRLFLLILAFIAWPVFAQVPFVDYMVSTTATSKEICLKDADNALATQGFTVTPSTGTRERVGKQGNFKAVIACLDQDDDGFVELTIFIVAGPAYKTAATFNSALVKSWEGN